MSKVSVVAKITAQPGKRDDVVAALGGLLAAAAEEPGTLLYLANTDGSNPDVVWFYEVYESQDALKAHQGSEAMKAAGGALGGLLAAAPELFFGEPVGGKGL
jgi:quinol monooxygenase YgiN